MGECVPSFSRDLVKDLSSRQLDSDVRALYIATARLEWSQHRHKAHERSFALPLVLGFSRLQRKLEPGGDDQDLRTRPL